MFVDEGIDLFVVLYIVVWLDFIVGIGGYGGLIKDFVCQMYVGVEFGLVIGMGYIVEIDLWCCGGIG